MPSTFQDIPPELVVVIAGKVASDSLQNVFSLKFCSKRLLEAANSDHVLKHVSLDKFTIAPCKKRPIEHLNYLRRCFNQNNPNASFRIGMMEFFGARRIESGFSHLFTAYVNGQKEAAYIVGIVIISTSNDLRKHGLTLLNSFQRSTPNWKIYHTRLRVHVRMKEMWQQYPVRYNRFVQNCPRLIQIINSLDLHVDENAESVATSIWPWDMEKKMFWMMHRGKYMHI